MIFPKMNDSAFFLKQLLFRPQALRCYRERLECESLSPDALRKRSFVRRLYLLKYAYDNTVYYRRRLDEAGIAPEEVRCEEDWAKLPLLTRDELKNHFSEICVLGVAPGRRRLMTTGGSTGEPVRVYHDAKNFTETIYWRTQRWWNISPGVHAAYCWRLPARSLLSRLKNQIMWFPTRRVWLDASFMTEANMSAFAKDFTRLRPEYFHGYVGAVHHFARFCADQRIELPSPLAISTTSAPLSPSVRNDIENVFHSPVYDQYGCCEIFSLAAQCRLRQALHINSDVRYVEFVNNLDAPVPPGEYGRVVITDLENRVFPLIRYENGDRGRALPGGCECGLPFPLMDTVKGRTTEMLYLPNGVSISGDYLTTIFDEEPDIIRGFQVRQQRDYSVTLAVLPKNNERETLERIEQITARLRLRLKPVSVRLAIVSELGHDRGKTRYITSEIEPVSHSPQ